MFAAAVIGPNLDSDSYLFFRILARPAGFSTLENPGIKFTLNLDQVMSIKLKGKSLVTIFPDWCKGCGICAAFCPAKVMELNDQNKAVVVREEECINCGFCELHCPDFAIMVKPKVENEVSKVCGVRDFVEKCADSNASSCKSSEKKNSITEKG